MKTYKVLLGCEPTELSVTVCEKLMLMLNRVFKDKYEFIVIPGSGAYTTISKLED